MTLLVTAVMSVVTGAMLSLANLMGHVALSAGLLTILMRCFAASMLRFTSIVPVVLTFLVFHLALSMLPVPETFPVMAWRRRMFPWRRRLPGVFWRWRRLPVVVRRPRLRASLHSRPEPQE